MSRSGLLLSLTGERLRTHDPDPERAAWRAAGIWSGSSRPAVPAPPRIIRRQALTLTSREAVAWSP